MYSFDFEPRGAEYADLLRSAPAYCDSALLVVRDDIKLDDFGISFLRSVERNSLSKKESHEWPGTILFEGSATVFRLRLDEHLSRRMTAAVDGLFDWKQPHLPEDLCLLRPNEDPWLISISHEHEAYLDINEREYRELKAVYPDLMRFVAYDPDPIP